MSKTATVTKAEYSRSFDGKYGTMYVHLIAFDNNDSGEYNSKSQDQNKFIVGQSVEYEITPGQGDYPARIKPVMQQQGKPFGGGGKRGSNASFALSYGKDWAIAQVNNGTKVSTQDILTVADTFLKWLNDNE